MAALVALLVVNLIVLVLLTASVKIVREHERAVIFRLGRLLDPPKGPGLFIVAPIMDRVVKVDLRTITLDIPPQEVITKDGVPVSVRAATSFRVIDPSAAVVKVQDFTVATSQIARTALRSVAGEHSLEELLSERRTINAKLQEIVAAAAAGWGIEVSSVEVEDVELQPSKLPQV